MQDTNNTTRELRKRKRPSERERVMQAHAPLILDLAEAALVAVQALIAAEEAAKAELGEQYGLFGSDETSLEDAEVAVSCARHCALQTLSGLV